MHTYKKNSRIAKYLSFIAISLYTAKLHAAIPGDFSISADIGGTAIADNKATMTFKEYKHVQPVVANLDFDPALNAGISGGYAMTKYFRTEISLDVSRGRFNFQSAIKFVTPLLDTVDQPFNGMRGIGFMLADLANPTNFTPFAGVGAGVNNLDMSGYTAIALLLSGKGGVDIALTSHNSLIIEYEYAISKDPKFEVIAAKSVVAGEAIKEGAMVNYKLENVKQHYIRIKYKMNL